MSRAHFSCRRLDLKPHDFPGLLVTFCGVDGSGKSSLIARIAEELERAGLTCARTATPTQRIRQDPSFRALVDDPTGASSDIFGLLLSILGDLVQHVSEVIVPRLERGEVVLCDRYVFTSHAEIVARSNLADTEPVLESIANRLLKPDVAFGLDISFETSERRVLARNDALDHPPPRDFLVRQVRAYSAVIEADGLVALDTERDLETTVARALSHLGPLCARAGLRRAWTAAPRATASAAAAPKG